MFGAVDGNICHEYPINDRIRWKKTHNHWMKVVILSRIAIVELAIDMVTVKTKTKKYRNILHMYLTFLFNFKKANASVSNENVEWNSHEEINGNMKNDQIRKMNGDG